MQQGNAKQAETLEKFRNDTNSVLLGTGSYWEGINIEGVSLSHVIIFKLPFPAREPIIDYKYQQSKGWLNGSVGSGDGYKTKAGDWKIDSE